VKIAKEVQTTIVSQEFLVNPEVKARFKFMAWVANKTMLKQNVKSLSQWGASIEKYA
jgi:hypothetical protein